MSIPNTCLVKIGLAKVWGHPTRLVSCGGWQCQQNVCKGVMGQPEATPKKLRTLEIFLKDVENTQN